MSKLMDLNRASAEKMHEVTVYVENEPVTIKWMNLTASEEPINVELPEGVEEELADEEEVKFAKQFAMWREMTWRRIDKANKKLGEEQITRDEFFNELLSEVQAQLIMAVMQVQERLNQDFQNGQQGPQKQSLFTGRSLNEE